MQYSMTGYAQKQYTTNNKTVFLEIKSLNSKGLEVNIKLPFYYKKLELECRNLIAEKLVKGKIDVNVYIEWHAKVPYLNINDNVILEYYNSLFKISKKLFPDNYSPDWLKIILNLPDVINTKMITLSEREKKLFFSNFISLLNNLNVSRKKEGKTIINDIKKHIKKIEQKIEKIQKQDPVRFKKIRKNIIDKLNTITTEIDKNRFEQEMLYYFDKLDINEEIIRLKKHIDYFKFTVTKEKYAGKKLTFITQEMHREINTIGSKCNDFIIQKEVVEIKDCIEKIKEHLANII